MIEGTVNLLEKSMIGLYNRLWIFYFKIITSLEIEEIEFLQKFVARFDKSCAYENDGGREGRTNDFNHVTRTVRKSHRSTPQVEKQRESNALGKVIFPFFFLTDRRIPLVTSKLVKASAWLIFREFASEIENDKLALSLQQTHPKGVPLNCETKRRRRTLIITFSSESEIARMFYQGINHVEWSTCRQAGAIPG